MNGLILSLSSADERMLVALLEKRRPRVDTLMRGVTRLGNWYVITPFTLALTAFGSPQVRAVGALALWSLVLSHVAVQVLKRGVCRERPQLPPGFARLIEPEDRFAFPSGHATAGLSVGLSIFLGLSGPLAWMALAAGLAIGVSRCWLGVHYPSDVLTGWVLATLAVVSLVILGIAG